MSEPALAHTPPTDVSLDIDSLHILPLSIIPFDTLALRRARLIKNSNLESMIELYRGEASGSGQTSPRDLRMLMRWKAGRRGKNTAPEGPNSVVPYGKELQAAGLAKRVAEELVR